MKLNTEVLKLMELLVTQGENADCEIAGIEASGVTVGAITAACDMGLVRVDREGGWVMATSYGVSLTHVAFALARYVEIDILELAPLDIIPDPWVGGCYAVQADVVEENAQFLVRIEDDGSESVEEVLFKQWPPKATL